MVHPGQNKKKITLQMDNMLRCAEALKWVGYLYFVKGSFYKVSMPISEFVHLYAHLCVNS